MHINVKRGMNMVIVKRTYRFRAYPSKGEQSTLNSQMYLCKELYNLLLQKAQEKFKDTGKTFTKYDMNKWITQYKKEHPEYKEIHSQVLQNVSDRMSKAYKNFFRRVKEKHNGGKQKVGFPRYKKFLSSLTYPQEGGFKIERKIVELSKIGRINIVNHRAVEGTPKTVSIKKTKSGQWHVTISVEKEDIPHFSNGKPHVGIDLGLINFVALSDGKILQNAKVTKEQRKHLKNLQQDISRKVKGSHNRKKAVVKFARFSEHIIRIRNDLLHKVSHQFVNSYSFIAYEELGIANMVRNHNLAKSISESSWGNFTQMLQYKAESAGCVAVGVNPQYTSMTCSECGNIQEISLSQRTFACEKCSYTKNRDINAAQNILDRATEGHSGSNACGDGVRPSSWKAVAEEAGTIFGASR